MWENSEKEKGDKMGDMLGYSRDVLSGSTETEDELFGVPQIAIAGIGGAGNNSMNRLEYMGGLNGVSRIAINTDKLHLDSIKCEQKVLIGKSLTKGLGAGGSPDIGRKAAELDRDAIRRLLTNKNFVFLTAGMGGGTGTGAAPVTADIAKEEGAIVVAMVSYPFEAERIRRKRAAEGIERLREATDTVIVLENDKLIKYAGNLPVNDAFRTMDMLIAETIQGITETITKPSLVNLDFADLKAVMEAGGVAVMLVGETAKAENKPEAVVEDALCHPLLEAEYRGAKGALIHVTGGSDLTMKETTDIVELLTYELDPDANVIWGARIDEKYNGKAKVTAIMTGVEPKWTFGGVYEERKVGVAHGNSGGLSDIIPIIRR
ncbi:MAG TPA: cell division protein FtsZ [Candidatus Bathyarchaeia archaeon]|nr:cell division protein FtsZ [Candidatus Bathyarchaeia archaeon]